MSVNIPFIRQISWPALFLQFILIGILIYIFKLSGTSEIFLLTAFTYSISAMILRNVFAKDHRHGIRLVRQNKFIEAIPFFERSVNYFTKNKWIDKFRSLTLLSSSKMTYKEMGLCNIAFCYSQSGDGSKAKEYYKQVLKEYPQNGLAIAGLNMLTSVNENKF